MLKGLLDDNGVNTEFVEMFAGPSGHAIIQVDKHGQNCIILFGGANQQIDEEFVNKVLENFNEDDIILLQNEISSISYIMKKAYQKRMRIYFNPSPANSKLGEYPMHYVDTLILNEVEGEQLTGQSNIDNILDSLITKYSEIKIVLTLGERGVAYADKDRREYCGIYENTVVDTTAAGDTFTGYFISCIVKEMDIKSSLNFAAAAASIAVSRLGAACSIPSLKDVEEFVIKFKR
jgi:ribokinase